MNAVNLILRDVAELDYAGFEGDLMMVTPGDLKLIVERHLAERSLSSVGAAGAGMSEDLRERVARAIWNIRRDEEDRCDMELEDMGESHSVWIEADAAIAAAYHAPTAQPAQPAQELLHWTGEPARVVHQWRKVGDTAWTDACHEVAFMGGDQFEARTLYAAAQAPAQADSRDAALEEAAKICDAQSGSCSNYAGYCATAIRALKSSPSNCPDNEGGGNG